MQFNSYGRAYDPGRWFLTMCTAHASNRITGISAEVQANNRLHRHWMQLYSEVLMHRGAPGSPRHWPGGGQWQACRVCPPDAAAGCLADRGTEDQLQQRLQILIRWRKNRRLDSAVTASAAPVAGSAPRWRRDIRPQFARAYLRACPARESCRQTEQHGSGFAFFEQSAVHDVAGGGGGARSGAERAPTTAEALAHPPPRPRP